MSGVLFCKKKIRNRGVLIMLTKQEILRTQRLAEKKKVFSTQFNLAMDAKREGNDSLYRYHGNYADAIAIGARYDDSLEAQWNHDSAWEYNKRVGKLAQKLNSILLRHGNGSEIYRDDIAEVEEIIKELQSEFKKVKSRNVLGKYLEW